MFYKENTISTGRDLMKTKKSIGALIIVLGIILFSIAMYSKHRVAQVKKNIHTGSSFLSDNPLDKEISKALDKKVGSYDAPILWAMIGGVVLVVVGIGTIAYGKKR